MLTSNWESKHSHWCEHFFRRTFDWKTSNLQNSDQNGAKNQESKAIMTGGGVLHIFKSTQPTVMKAANLQSPKQNVIATIKLQ